MSALTIDIWSDIACPWCWVGKRRLEQALEGFPGEVAIQWRSFELNPGAEPSPPADHGVDYVAKLARKYGTSRDRAQQMIDNMVATGAAEGIGFRFDIARPGNTFDAHRLLHWAAEQGGLPVQNALKERLFAAYLSEGEPISERNRLAAQAAAVGLDADEALALLAGEDYAREVRGEEAQARQMGITGVPFFVVGRKYAVSGAQPATFLRQVLDKVAAEQAPTPIPLSPESEAAPACGPEGCEVPA